MPALPTCVQYIGGPCGGGGTAYAQFHFRFRNRSLAGNLLVVVGQYASNASVTAVNVTDDQSQTWTVALRATANLNQTLYIAYFPNTAAGVRHVTVTYTGANPTGQMKWAGEFNNIVTTSPVAASNSHNGTSGTAITCGSVTPSQAGDLVIAAAEGDSTGSVTNWTPGANSNITWTRAMADRGDQGSLINQTVQWGIYNSAAAINPAITVAPATTYNAITVIFKASASTQGSPAPAGILAGSSHHFNCPSISTGHVFQAPLTGNLVAFVSAYPASGSITSITDNKGNSWTHLGFQAEPGAAAGADFWLTQNATLGDDYQFTVNISGTMVQQNITVYGISAAHPSALDTGVGTAGFASNTGNLTTQNANVDAITVTPTTPNGIIICSIQVNSSQIQDCVGIADADTAYSVDEAGINEMDENNGEAHYYNPDTASRTFTFTTHTGPTGIGNWSSVAAAFKAAAGVLGCNLPTVGPSMRI
jgi:hypothetical protein